MANPAEPKVISLRGDRLNRGLTLRQAATEIGVSVGALQRAESGFTLNPSNAKAVADFYGYEVTEIWPLSQTERAAA